MKTIAVVGPNADDDLQQLGDWSLGSPQHPPEAGKHPREKTTTVLDGIRALAPAGSSVRYERGCSIVDDDLSGIPAAVAAAQAADVVVAVVGDHLNFIGEEQEHRHARAAGRTGRAARRAGEDRQADGRRAGEQQAARAAALGQARRGDPRGLQLRHGGRPRGGRGAVRPAEPVRASSRSRSRSTSASSRCSTARCAASTATATPTSRRSRSSRSATA